MCNLGHIWNLVTCANWPKGCQRKDGLEHLSALEFPPTSGDGANIWKDSIHGLWGQVALGPNPTFACYRLCDLGQVI